MYDLTAGRAPEADASNPSCFFLIQIKMNVQDLIAKRARVWEAAKSFLDVHRGENGVLSAEDGETYDRMEKEITDLTKEIDRLNRQTAIEAQLNQPTFAPLSNMPNRNDVKMNQNCTAKQTIPFQKGTATRTVIFLILLIVSGAVYSAFTEEVLGDDCFMMANWREFLKQAFISAIE